MIASEYGYTVDQFLDLTARQIVAFSDAIQVRRFKEEYYRQAAAARLHNAHGHTVELTPLEDILGVASKEEASAFDPKTDEILERRAMQLLEERQKGKT